MRSMLGFMVGSSLKYDQDIQLGEEWESLSLVDVFNWLGISSDASKVLIHSGRSIYKSTNYGNNFTGEYSFFMSGPGLANSSDLQIKYVVEGWWSPPTFTRFIRSCLDGSTTYNVSAITGNNFQKIACSSNGQYVFVTTVNSHIFQSNNYANNSTYVTSEQWWKDVCCSSAGNIVYGFYDVYGQNYIGIAKSTNNGSSYSYKQFDSGAAANSIICNSGGDKVLMTTDALWTSENYAENFTFHNYIRSYTSVACSPDFKVLVAGHTSGIMLSLDYGGNWTEKLSGNNVTSVKVSSDGTYIYALSGSTLYRSNGYVP